MRKLMSNTTLAISLTLAMSVHGVADAQDIDPRADEFRAACAACHGEDAKGGVLLGGTVETPDLTTLSKNNDGVFPTLKVFQIVDGRTVVDGHGERSMPVWGDRYKIQAGDKYGQYGSEPLVRARVLELVYYLQSLQE